MHEGSGRNLYPEDPGAHRLNPYNQTLSYHEFEPGEVAWVLGLEPPPVETREKGLAGSHLQLKYLEEYVSNAALIGMACRSFLVEHHYVDRDHMEDHAVFYSRSFFPYPNYCKRIHFFSLDPADVRTKIESLRLLGRDPAYSQHGEDTLEEELPSARLEKLREFSREAYLGFAVIKPLSGCPVGRTVLRCPTRRAPDGGDNFLATAQQYTAHVSGVELWVKGIPFQQQDQAVAACATTAVWVSLHPARAHADPVLPVTPAQITTLATHRSLAFGRAMPSQGLSIDQMSQAIEATGASAVVTRVVDFASARAHLYSVLRSGGSPVLVLKRRLRSGDARTPVREESGSPKRDRDLDSGLLEPDDDKKLDSEGLRGSDGPGFERHAVAAVGLTRHRDSLVANDEGRIDAAAATTYVYVHDDRVGPYLTGTLESEGTKVYMRLRTDISDRADLTEIDQRWRLTHLVTPTHPKIRIGVRELQARSISPVVADVGTFWEIFLAEEDPPPDPPAVEHEAWISRSYKYVSDLLADDEVPVDVAERVATRLSLPRYIGVIRIDADFTDPIDVLIDSTSTSRNLNVVAVVARGMEMDYTTPLIEFLNDLYNC